MDVSTVANSWVSSYLDALMSAGLSSEHIHTQNASPPMIQSGEKSDANQSSGSGVCAKYYVNQILGLDEEGIKSAWKRSLSAAPSQQNEKDQRLEYLSWRVWGMKRKRQEVSAQEARERVMFDEEDEEEAELAQLTSFSVADLNKIVSNPLGSQQYNPTRNMSAVFGRLSEANMSGYREANSSRYSEQRDGSVSYPKGLPPHIEAEISDLSHLSSHTQDSITSSAPGSGMELSSPQAKNGVGMGGLDFMDRIPRLYIILISMHGLVRGKDMELGRDPDTGGQVKYVVELARALGRMPNVLRVDLLTRLVDDPAVDASYGKPEEQLLQRPDAGSLAGAYITRIPCGPAKTYLGKEELWPHVREFADGAIAHASDMLARLQGSHGGSGGATLHVVHGHYADAGEAAALVAHTLGVDMVLTGHSLGRNKRDHLLKQGSMSRAEIEQTYKMTRRIEGEERALDAAMQVFTSTREEIEKQWGLYDGYNAELANALRNRPCKGYHVPDMLVIPPGLDFSNLKVQLGMDPWDLVLGQGATPECVSPGAPQAAGASPRAGMSRDQSSNGLALPQSRHVVEAAAQALKHNDGGGKIHASESNSKLSDIRESSEQSGNTHRPPPRKVSMSGYQTPSQPEPPIWGEIGRFLNNRRKPCILTLCRADAKKNVASLIHAYGQSKLLREISNLVLVLGNRQNIDDLTPGSASVMTSVLKLIDAYDLYGCVAYPKKHQQQEVSDIYLLAAATKGVFVNPALQEPFGLTLIEAAAHGVPIVATQNGGPVDIVQTLQNGLLVDPTSPAEIADSLIKIVTNPEVWERFSNTGKTNIVAYSWPSHCLQYLKAISSEKAHPVMVPLNHLRPTLSEEDLEKLDKVCDTATEMRTFSMPASRLSASHIEALSQHPGLGSPHPGPRRRESNNGIKHLEMVPSGDVSPLDDSKGMVAGCEVELMFSRPGGYVVFSADDEGDLAQVSELLLNGGAAALQGEKAAGVAGTNGADGSSDEPVGYGLLTTLSFKELQVQLRKAAGQDPSGGGDDVLTKLDFLVTLAGAQVWHQRADGMGWVCDDHYQDLIDFRWEPFIVKQVMKRLASGTTGWSKLPINKEGCATLRMVANTGPFNAQIFIQPPAQPSTTQQPALEVDILLARLLCKMRKSGVRANLLATMATPPSPGMEGGSFVASGQPAGGNAQQMAIHVTPLRGNRALSVRYVAHRYKLDFSRFTMVLFYASNGGGAAPKGQPLEVGSSDAADLMGGMQQVLLVAGTSPIKSAENACRFKVDLAPYAKTARVRVM